MEREDLSIVIVGHVDHGKSTLIGRLLYDTGSIPQEKMDEITEVCEAMGRPLEFGFVLDNLEEERDQGITIDTTQIFFDTDKRHYTIIDAPGHVEFLKNMITGASQAEAAILIVDAEEGVQEQSRRHAYILSMLGLGQVIVVVNKMDAVGRSEERFAAVRDEIAAHLGRLGVTPAHVIPISALEGDNIASKSAAMAWYGGPSVLEALDAFARSPPPSEKPLRFAVQDVYRHEKRIAVGRVESGVLRAGMEAIILPSGERTTVASIEEFLKEDVREAGPGRATGVVTTSKAFLDRGSVLTDPSAAPAVRTAVTGQLFWMDKEPLKKGETLTFSCSTQDVQCRVEAIDGVIDSSTLEAQGARDELRDREAAHVTLAMQKPVLVEAFGENPAFGKFVLERKHTVGGGIVTEERA